MKNEKIRRLYDAQFYLTRRKTHPFIEKPLSRLQALMKKKGPSAFP
jgi:hypothetical protein